MSKAVRSKSASSSLLRRFRTAQAAVALEAAHAGIFIGGYGAIRFGMRHPDVFGSVYAIHPVGTGIGVGLSATIPKWDILANAKSMDDVKKDGGTRIFTTMFQAHLPNPDKPPLFIDLLLKR
jgi:hypothetical protein